MTRANGVRVVLFELGGVLVELAGVPTMLSWMNNRVSPQELWRMWLTSPVVRAFETGRTTPESFAGELMEDMRLAEAFDHHFASHLIGKIKPDEEVFHHVTETLHCAAEEVLFLDDNLLNVETASKVGMNAVRTQGLAAAERVLIEAGVIEN
jgi:glucose-1-phosphatase